MARKKNKIEKIEISKEVKQKIERKARREAALDLGIGPYKTKVHKNKKKYQRKPKHRNRQFIEE